MGSAGAWGDLRGSQGAQLVLEPARAGLVPAEMSGPHAVRCSDGKHTSPAHVKSRGLVSAVPLLLRFYPQHKTGSSFCARELPQSLQLPTFFFLWKTRLVVSAWSAR